MLAKLKKKKTTIQLNKIPTPIISDFSHDTHPKYSVIVKTDWTQAMFKFAKWGERQIPETTDHWQAIKTQAPTI